MIVDAHNHLVKPNSGAEANNPKILDFFIIKGGEENGVTLGDELVVHRGGEKIAEAYIIEVRPSVAAAETLKLKKGKNVLEGDSVSILKVKPTEPVKPKTRKEARKAKKTAKKAKKEVKLAKPVKPKTKKARTVWTSLKPKASELVAPEAEKASSAWTSLKPKAAELVGPEAEKASSVWTPKSSRAGAINKVSALTVLSVDINSPLKEVFAYARLSLNENGFSIASSNRSTGIMLAKKPIHLTIMNELWADAVAAIDHNLVVSFEIKETKGLSNLRAFLYKEHFQKEKYIKRAVAENSKDYNAIKALMSEIKERSEY